MTMKQIADCLLNIGPMSAFELQLHIGVSRLATNKQIKQLRTKGLVRVDSFERQPNGTKGRCIPVYALGDAPDALALRALTSKIINQRYNARHAAIISTRRYSKQRGALGVWAGLA